MTERSESSPLDAFNHCPNKALIAAGNSLDAAVSQRNTETQRKVFDSLLASTKILEVVCAQFPFGSHDVVTEQSVYIGDDGHREEVAKKLGCSSCVFKDAPMERISDLSISPGGYMHVEVKFKPL